MEEKENSKPALLAERKQGFKYHPHNKKPRHQTADSDVQPDIISGDGPGILHEPISPEAREVLSEPLLLSRDRDDYEALYKKHDILTSSTAKKNRSRIKSFFESSGFLDFLFREYRTIRKFGENTHILRCTFFPPRTRINRDILAFFDTTLQRYAIDVSKCLNHILSMGWLHLDKMEYNIIFQFNELCRAIIATNFKNLDYKDRNLIDKIRDLENLFITCHYRVHYPEIIIASITFVAERYPNWKIKPVVLKEWIKCILLPDSLKPSLYYFICGLNIIKYRRRLEFRQLIWGGFPGVINNFSFECDKHVRSAIDRHIEATLNQLLEIMKQEQDLEKINKFIPFNTDGTYDFSMMVNLYKRTKFDFEKDSGNIVLFIENFYGIFMLSYGKFLHDEIRIESGEKIKVFAPEYFEHETGKMRFILQKWARYKYTFPDFPRQRYLELQHSRKGRSVQEVEIMQMLNELLMITQSIAKKLIDIEAVHTQALPLNSGRECKPVEPAMVFTKKAVIPHWDRRVEWPSAIQGRPVYQTVIEAISLSLAVGLFFQDNYLRAALNKSHRFAAEIKEKKKTLERLTNFFQYRRIRERFNL